MYALKHNQTGKIYIGCSRDVERRIREHLTALRSHYHPVDKLQQDYDLYGSNFSYYVLCEAYNGIDAFFIEKQFMSLLHTRDDAYGYNTEDSSSDFSLDQYEEHIIPVGSTKIHKRISKHQQPKCKDKTIYFYLRRKMNYTLDQAAEMIGVTKQAVSRWENGDGCPRKNLIDKVASCYKVSADDLNDEEFIKKVFSSSDIKSERVRRSTNKNGDSILFKNLLHLCNKEKISISELEQRTNISKRSIYDWSDHVPSIDKVKRVADYFGVTMDELMREDLK